MFIRKLGLTFKFIQKKKKDKLAIPFFNFDKQRITTNACKKLQLQLIYSSNSSFPPLFLTLSANAGEDDKTKL